MTRKGDQMHAKGEEMLVHYLLSVLWTLTSLCTYPNLRGSLPVDLPVHEFQPGDEVYICTWRDEPLKENGKDLTWCYLPLIPL